MKPKELIATEVAAQDKTIPAPSLHCDLHASYHHTNVSAACGSTHNMHKHRSPVCLMPCAVSCAIYTFEVTVLVQCTARHLGCHPLLLLHQYLLLHYCSLLAAAGCCICCSCCCTDIHILHASITPCTTMLPLSLLHRQDTLLWKLPHCRCRSRACINRSLHNVELCINESTFASGCMWLHCRRYCACEGNVIMSACREKLSQLRNTGDAISFRASELQARPEALQLARQFVDLTMHSVQGWSSSKPWINATDKDNLLAEVCSTVTPPDNSFHQAVEHTKVYTSPEHKLGKTH